jgi:hypothetical protein
MRLISLTLLAIAASLGCGSSNDDNGGAGARLDCAWLESDNCWKQTVRSAQSCLPPSSPRGTFNADNSQCSYADGHLVTFTPSLALPLGDDPAWNFAVTSGGNVCLQYQDNPNEGVRLTAGGKTVSESSSGGMGIKITCPDGSSYGTSNALNLLSCPGGFTGLPGNAWSGSSTSVYFSLVGVGEESVDVFGCSK